MEIRKVKDLIKLVKYGNLPAAFYLDYKSGEKYKHVLWKYDTVDSMLTRLDYDIKSKGLMIEEVMIESIDVCMTLLDDKKFIKVFASERSLID